MRQRVMLARDFHQQRAGKRRALARDNGRAGNQPQAAQVGQPIGVLHEHAHEAIGIIHLGNGQGNAALR